MNIKILLVEDDLNRAQQLKIEFDLERLDITHVTTAEDALDLLSKENFDFIISDVNLDRMSGIKLLEKIDGKISSLLYTNSNAPGLHEIVGWMKDVKFISNATIMKIKEEAMEILKKAIEENSRTANSI